MEAATAAAAEKAAEAAVEATWKLGGDLVEDIGEGCHIM
jgi:hypothetical protein